MNSHLWIAIQYTIVNVGQAEDGELIVSATEEAIELATDEALYGCWYCNTILTTDSFGTPCSEGK